MSSPLIRFTRLSVLIFIFSLWVGVSTADSTVGTINPATSIIGETAGDKIGANGMKILPSGNLVIASGDWGGGRGAVTCLTPAEYKAGGVVIDDSNSLIGDSAGDRVGSGYGLQAGVYVLTTGDYIVSSPEWDNGAATDVGAVTWVDGDTCIPYGESSRAAVVSVTNSMIGSTTGDGVGRRFALLPNGNYIIESTLWDNGALTNTGAITFCHGATGCAGMVSVANSLIGLTSGEGTLASNVITVLSDSDYVVQWFYWDGIRGAVTWCSGKTGCTGVIGADNSVVGSTANDSVGFITPLTNGNYLVTARLWDNGAVVDAGAVRWCSGMGGCVGAISAANALVGMTADDQVGRNGSFALTNGNYVVSSWRWASNGISQAGAATWCNGTTGCKGTISPSNSLVGSQQNDHVGLAIFPLPNGNYIVGSSSWANGALPNAGALTWCNGISGCKGAVSTANSLVGSSSHDSIGAGSSVYVLKNGNVVLTSPNWSNLNTGMTIVGAVTFINGETGLSGTITPSNSLVGSQTDDVVGDGGIVELADGNFVVSSRFWNNGAVMDVGAITWVNGKTGLIGTVSAANSLVGSHTNDQIGRGEVVALTNGNYVAESSSWNGGGGSNRGAVTWCDGRMACVGVVSASTSLIGSTANDAIGNVYALPNGNYVVVAGLWDNPATTEANVGMIAWGDGEEGGLVGEISAANAIIGSTPEDRVGFSNIGWLPNGDLVLFVPQWDNGGIVDAGAIIRINGATGAIGEITASNALIGSATGELGTVSFLAQPDNSFFINIASWNNDTGIVIYSPGPENLLKNPSFETAGLSAKFALNWKTSLSATGADKRICDKPTKPITRTAGSCIFQFNSTTTPLKGRTVKQIINNPVWGTAGNVLTLTADVEGLKVTGSTRKIILNIKYDNNTTDRATLTIPAGTYDYQTLVGTVKLTRTVKKVTVTLNPGMAKGRIRIDNLFLSVSSAPTLRFPALGENTTRDGASPFEMPTAPEGFRH